jgi:hypothetical protein
MAVWREGYGGQRKSVAHMPTAAAATAAENQTKKSVEVVPLTGSTSVDRPMKPSMQLSKMCRTYVVDCSARW